MDGDVKLLAVKKVLLNLLRRPDMEPLFDVLLDPLHNLVVLLLPDLALLREHGVRIVCEPYCLDEVANEGRRNVAELGCFGLAEALLEDKLGNLLQLSSAELVLRLLSPLLAVTAYLKGEHGRALFALLELFLAASVQVQDGGRQLEFLNIVGAVSCSVDRLRLRHEIHPQPSSQRRVVTQLFLA